MNNKGKVLQKLAQFEIAIKDKDFEERKIVFNKFAQEIVKLFAIPVVSNNEVALIDFLIHLNNKGLINNHDFDYEKEAKKYIKKLINDCYTLTKQ
jgi:hypothetical protein